MNYFILLYGFISFFATLFLTRWLIKYLTKIDLVVKDQNKKNKPLIPISGGLAVLSGIFAGLFAFIFVRTFFDNGSGFIINDHNLMLLFAGMTSLLIITLVGFLDDVLINIKKNTQIKLDNQSSDYKWINKVEKSLHPYVRLTLNDSKIFYKIKRNNKKR